MMEFDAREFRAGLRAGFDGVREQLRCREDVTVNVRRGINRERFDEGFQENTVDYNKIFGRRTGDEQKFRQV